MAPRALSETDTSQRWVPIDDAMMIAGLSRSQLIELADREGVKIRYDDQQAEVSAGDLTVAIGHARITRPRSPDPADGDRIGLPAAARLVGTGYGSLLRAVHAGQLHATRSQRRWHVTPADLQAWAEPLGLGPVGSPDPGRCPSLLERVLARPGWDQQRLASTLGADLQRVRR